MKSNRITGDVNVGEAKRKKERQAAMEEAAKEAPKPTCPKCGVEISEFGQAQITLVNGLMCYMLWCGVETCRALFSCQIMGQSRAISKRRRRASLCRVLCR
jgi:hypothetical protein